MLNIDRDSLTTSHVHYSIIASVLRILRLIAGVILVLIGLFALVTPLTPGAWLGLIGLELLGFGFLIPKKIRRMWKKEQASPLL